MSLVATEDNKKPALVIKFKRNKIPKDIIFNIIKIIKTKQNG